MIEAGSVMVADGPTTTVVSDPTVLTFTDGRLAFDPSHPVAQVYRLYQATLDRAPDGLGARYWVDAIETGKRSLTDIAAGFTNSVEFQTKYGSTSDEQFTQLLYSNVLDRAGDASGVQYWVGRLASGISRQEVVVGFSESAEFKQKIWAATPNGIWVQDGQAASIARLYYATLDRAPDSRGLSDWTAAAKGGMSLVEIAGGFTQSSEFQTRYGPLTDSEFVDLLYENVLDRAADLGGKAHWLTVLSQSSRESVVIGFSESQEFQMKAQPLLDDGFLLAL